MSVKGRARNARCHCGSGKKAKRCGPHLSLEELTALHAEALDEDFYFHTDEGRVALARMTAADRRRAGMLVGVALALAR